MKTFFCLCATCFALITAGFLTGCDALIAIDGNCVNVMNNVPGYTLTVQNGDALGSSRGKTIPSGSQDRFTSLGYGDVLVLTLAEDATGYQLFSEAVSIRTDDGSMGCATINVARGYDEVRDQDFVQIQVPWQEQPYGFWGW